ncbi:MAG: phenylalanine--tRNA ligase subunit beta [Patescibacteria group bacterium]
MKYLKSWLKDYVDISISDQELIDKLTVTGTEIESADFGLDDNIIIAKILEISPHPNADRLRLAKVTNGSHEFEVVCGAPNIEVGQIVPLALVGSKIGGQILKAAEIRGIKSNGMLCSEKELGLGEEGSGIKILDQNYRIGEKLSKYIESDMVIEAEITPNRGDCLSHLGLAREIAGFSKTVIKNDEGKDAAITAELKIEIEKKESCPRYYGYRINNISVGPSPEWLKKRLIILGFKPINNIVDITNYIMLDLGHPLHAFDADKVSGHTITIRDSRDGESIMLLDGKNIKLQENDLLIADKEKALALAGVMGGQDTGVTETTKNIILEAAEFSSSVIRKIAKTHNIVSDASYRFERGIDSAMVKNALVKAAKMIIEIAAGDDLGFAYSGEKDIERQINIPYQKINQLLDLNLSEDDINSTLKYLGFKIEGAEAKIPSWRHDITVWQDLAEEVERIYGIDNLKRLELPEAEKPQKSIYYQKERLKDMISDLGFSEVKNYSFLSEKDIKTENMNTDNLLEVANPIQHENKYLRDSLIPSLLKNVAKNGLFDPILLFEIGNVFNEEKERTNLAVVSTGKDARKEIDNIHAKLSQIQNDENIEIKELKGGELLLLKIRKPVVYAIEISLADLDNEDDLELRLDDKEYHYKPVSKYPVVARDLAFVVDTNTNPSEISGSILEISDKINRVELFDEYASDKLGAGKKNLAYHIYLQDMEKTLTDVEADETISKIISKIENQYSAKLRDS